MSHYAVLVLHKSNNEEDYENIIANMLALFDENLKVKPYKYQTKEKAINYMKEHVVPFNDFMKDYSDEELLNWYLDEYSSYSLGEDGYIYTTYNPNSKWDWWCIGGRFSEYLSLTDKAFNRSLKEYKEQWGEEVLEDYREEYRYVSSAPVKDIQWITLLSPEKKEQLKRWWEINIEGDEPKEGEEKDKWFIWKPEYYKQRYKDADTYIKLQEQACFHAVVTPDGIWHEPSEMGWFAMTDGDPADELKWDLAFYDTFIKTADPDWIATIIDCHI